MYGPETTSYLDSMGQGGYAIEASGIRRTASQKQALEQLMYHYYHKN